SDISIYVEWKMLQKSFIACMKNGNTPLNNYVMAQSGGKKDLTKMDEAEKKRAYRTAGYVFLVFGLALIFLLVGFVAEIFGKQGEIWFTLAIGVEIVEFILIAWAIKRK